MTSPARTAQTLDVVVVVSSSSPSPPRKTSARSPRFWNTPAISGASEASATPIAEATCVGSTITVGELHELCASSGFSRFPVRMGAVDGDGALTGYVHVKDTLADPVGERLRPERIRRLAALAADDPLDDVLERMQSARAHLALVEGDAGMPEAMVSLEDVLARLVGEIRGAANDAGH